MTDNPHHSLIQAIADLDIDAVEKFMDDGLAHFQVGLSAVTEKNYKLLIH